MAALSVLLAATTLAVWPGLLEDFETPKAAILLVGSLALLAGRLSRGRAAWPARPSLPDAAMAVLLLATAASTIFSLAPWTSFVGDVAQHDGLLTMVALTALYTGARSIFAAGSEEASLQLRMRCFHLYLALSSLVALYAVLQVAGLDPILATGVPTYGEGGVYRRPSSFLGHPNLMGVVTAAGGALAVSLLPSARGPRRVLLSLAMFASVLATIFSISRAAWIALAGAAAVGAAVAMMSGPAERRRAIRAPLLWSASVLLGAAGIAWFLFRGVLTARLGELLAFGRASGASRLEIWKSALAAFQAHPVLGTGPDTFGATFGRFQTPEYWRMEWGLIPQHAHSVYLNVLATRGAIGLLALAFVGSAFVLALRGAWRRGGASRRDVAPLAALGAALSIVAMAGAVGIAGGAILAVIVAAAASLDEGRARRAGSPRGAADAASRKPPKAPPRAPARRRRMPGARAAAVSVAAVAIVAGIAVWRDLAAIHAAARAENLLASSPSTLASVSAAGREAAHAETLAPYRDRYAEILARALVMGANRGGDRLSLARQALAAARRAVARSPAVARHHVWRGHAAALLAAAGDGGAAAEMGSAYERAITLAPYDVYAMNQIAERWLTVGRADRALEIAGRSARLYPGEGWSLAVQGIALLQMGRREEGRSVLEEAVGGEWRDMVRGKREAEAILRQLAAEGVPSERRPSSAVIPSLLP